MLRKAVCETLEQRQLLSANIYSNDFSSTAGSEWSKQNLAVSPSGQHFLGQFGGGNNAYLNGGYTWVTGRSGTGSALQLSASGTGYAYAEPDDTLQFSGSSTVSIWVKFTSTPTNAGIVDDVPTTSLGGFRLGVSGGKLYFEIRASSGVGYSNQSVTGGTMLTSGSWYHLVGQFDAATGTISTYVNNSLDRQTTTTGTMGTSLAQTMMIGRFRNSPNNYLDGTIDDFQIFNRALSSNEIGQLPGSVTDGLQANLLFNEGTGSRTFDSAGSAGVKLNLSNLPAHTQLTLSFDLYIIQTWDGRSTGSSGPDIWSLTEDGTPLLYTTFANGNTAGQSYPGTYPTASHPKQTGASAVNSLGYVNGSTPLDSTYHLTYTFSHTASSVVLNFTGAQLEGLYDESFGLDNVVVTSNPATAVTGTSNVAEGSPYTLNLFSGNSSTTGWSINWGDGSSAQSVTGDPSTVPHTYADNGNYTVNASATYAGTAHSAAAITAAISNVAPTLSATGTSVVHQGATYTLDLSSTDPGTDTISSWTVDWGDGATPQVITGNPSSVTHVFNGDVGNYMIAASATDEDGTYAATPYAVNVVGPVKVLATSFNYETSPHTISVKFDQDVSASLSASDLIVELDTSDTPLNSSDFTLSYNHTTNTATFSYVNGALPSGNYHAAIGANNVTNASGDPLVHDVDFDFWFKAGDLNRDRVAGSADVAIVNAHLGSTGTFTQGDVDYDGNVTPADASAVYDESDRTLPVSRPAPTGLTLLQVSATQNKIGWLDNLNDEDGYRIQRSTDGASFSTIVTTAANTVEYTDTNVTSGTHYWYRLRAVGLFEDSAYSAKADASTPLATPTTFSAVALDGHTIDLEWTDNSANETGFEIWKSIGSAPYTFYTTTDADATDQEVDALAVNTSYHFEVRAINNSSVSTFSLVTRRTQTYGLPIVLSSTFDYQTSPHSLSYEFDQNVGSRLNDSKLLLTNLTTGNQIGTSNASLSYDNNVGTFTEFPGSVLPSGNYEAVLDGSTLSTSSADYSSSFFFLMGDMNHDRVVDDTDINTFVGILTGHISLPDNATATFGLGDFNYDGSIDNGDINSIASNYGVQLPTPPVGANSLTVTAATDDPSHKIALNWTAPDTGTWDGFRIFRSSDGVTYTQVNELDDPSARNWTDTGLTDGTKYTYRVRSFTAAAGDSLSTNKASAVTVLPAPSNVAVTPTSSKVVHVTWQDNSAGETGFVVEMAVGDGSFNPVGTTAANATSFDMTGLGEGFNFSFRVHAINTNATSATSDSASCTTPPNSASLLAASPEPDSKVLLTWDDSSSIESGFQIQRATAGSWHNVGTVDANTTDYTDTTAQANTDYDYRVVTVTDSLDSPASNVVPFTTSDATGTVELDSLDFKTETAPHRLVFSFNQDVSSTFTTDALLLTNLTTGQQILPSQMSVAFTTSTASGAIEYLATVTFPGITATGFADGMLPTGNYEATLSRNAIDLAGNQSRLFYILYGDANRDRAANALDFNALASNYGSSPATLIRGDFNGDGTINDLDFNILYANFGKVLPLPPAAPLNVQATIDSSVPSAPKIDLSWSAVAGAAGYRIFKSTDGETYSQVAETTDTSWPDPAHLPDGTSFTYLVRAFTNAAGESAAAEAPAVLTDLIAPTGLTAIASSDGSVALSWADNSESTNGFEIDWAKVGTDFNNTDVTTVGGGTTSTVITGLAPGTSYNFRISAFNAVALSSSSSSTEPVTPVVPTPQELSVRDVSDSELDLEWADSDSTQIDGFTIERSEDGSSWSDVGTASADDPEFEATGLDPDTTYYFQVVGTNSSAPDSAPSEIVSDATRPSAPEAPSDLVATSTLTNEVDLTWTDKSNGKASFIIERLDVGIGLIEPDFEYLATVPPGETSFRDLNLQDSSGHFYRVQATDAGGTSGFSDQVLGGTGLSGPTSLEVDGVYNGEVNLTWTRNSTNDYYYTYDYRPVGGSWAYQEGDFEYGTTFATGGAAGSTAGTIQLGSGAYQIKISAIGRGYTQSDWSNIVNVNMGTIQYDQPIVTFRLGQTNSNSHWTEGDSDLSLVVQRSGTNGNLTVPLYPLSDDLNDESLFSSFPTEVTIPNGESSVTIPIDAPEDSIWHGEGVVLEPTGGPATSQYTVAGGINGQWIGYTDNDVDLTVDSNNDGRIDAADDLAERNAGPTDPGLIIPTNDDDSDGDLIPNYAEGYDRDGSSTNAPSDDQPGGTFMPLLMSIPNNAPVVGYNIDLSNAWVKFSYDASDPLDDIQPPSTPGNPWSIDGSLRLWTKDANQSRSGYDVDDAVGDFIQSDVKYPASDLGLTSWGTPQTFYIEALKPSTALRDQTITVTFDPDGDGPLPTSSATVHLTAVNLDVLIGANDENDYSVHDDWVGAKDGDRKNTILNFVELKGPPGVTVPLDLFSPSGIGNGTVNLIDPISGLNASDIKLLLTAKQNGTDSVDFTLSGATVSAKTEDVTVEVEDNKRVFASQTLTVLKFSTEPEIGDEGNNPINPLVKYNLNDREIIAADAGVSGASSAYVAHDGDKLAGTTPPLLTSGASPSFTSSKLHPDNIEVVWDREVVTNGTAVSGGSSGKRSTDGYNGYGNSSIMIAPANDNGSSPAMTSNLRIQDHVATITSDPPPNTHVIYYLGHPTERARQSLDIGNNFAASIDILTLPQLNYQLNFNVVTYTPPGGTIQTTGLSNSDLTSIFSDVGNIWNQIGVSFSEGAGTQTVTAPSQTQWDLPDDDLDHLAGLTTLNARPGIDVYFVRSINTADHSGFLNGGTLYQRLVSADRTGIVIAVNGSNGLTGPRNSNAQLAKTLAHELAHYLENFGDEGHYVGNNIPRFSDKVPKPAWNLFRGGQEPSLIRLDLNGEDRKLVQDDGVTPDWSDEN